MENIINNKYDKWLLFQRTQKNSQRNKQYENEQVNLKMGKRSKQPPSHNYVQTKQTEWKMFYIVYH